MAEEMKKTAEVKTTPQKQTVSKVKEAKKTKNKKMRTYQQRQDRAGYMFMIPWIVGFTAFTLFPLFFTVYLSFTKVKTTALGYDFEFTGVKNYMIIPYTFIVVVLSFIIAYLLSKIKTGKGILRTLYFLPVVIMSGPVMEQIMTVQSAGETASAAEQLAAANEQATAYSNIFIMQIIESYSSGLAHALAGIFDQLSIILWFTGIPIVLFINGLQKINGSIYEAAKIDSANAWQIMWKITIPMLKQTGLIITVFTVIQLGMFGSINPLYSLIEEKTGETGTGLGFAATYAWIYSIIVLIIVGFVFLLFKDRKPKDIKARQKQEKKLKKLEKQQKKRLAAQKRHQKKEAKLYGK